MGPRHTAVILAASAAISGCWLAEPDSFHVADSREDLLLHLSGGNEACYQCLTTGCQSNLDLCLADADCARLTTCRADAPSPAGTVTCDLDSLFPQESHRTSGALLGCRDQCYEQCNTGTRFACAGNYTWPPPVHDSVVLTQRLIDTEDEAPIVGAEVRVCANLVGCAQPQGEAVSDATGTYSVEVGVASSNTATAGWRGVREIRAPGRPVFRFFSNRPTVRDQSEELALFSTDLLIAFTVAAQMKADLATIFFKIFDCSGSGAEGATVEIEGITDSGDPLNDHRIYFDPKTPLSDTQSATIARGDGTGVLYNLPADQTHTLVVRVAGREVARSSVYAPRGQWVLVALHPDGAP